MREEGIPEGIVSRDDIAELALLFDRSENAFDPLSLEAKEARCAFEERVQRLYRERVEPRYQSVAFADFRIKLRSLCRSYLRKNPPWFSPLPQFSALLTVH